MPEVLFSFEPRLDGSQKVAVVELCDHFGTVAQRFNIFHFRQERCAVFYLRVMALHCFYQ